VACLVLEQERPRSVEERDGIVEAADVHPPETTIPRP
jgi:hypothetical protein